MRMLSIVLLSAILFAPAHPVVAQTNAPISTRREAMYREIRARQLTEQASKLDQLRQKADELRQTVGLAPVNLEKMGILDFSSQLNSWKWAAAALQEAQARLKTAEAMSPQERDVASKLYVSTWAMYEQGTRPRLLENETNIVVRNGEWLLKTIQQECWSLSRVKDADQECLGITNDAVNIPKDTLRQLDKAQRELEVQRDILKELKKRAETQQPCRAEAEFQQAREHLDALRKEAGLAPEEIKDADWTPFISIFWAWKTSRDDLRDAQLRLEKVKSMTPFVRETMILGGLFLPRRDDLDLPPHEKGDDQWLIRATEKECAVLQSELEARGKAMGVLDPSTDLTDQTAFQIDKADSDVRVKVLALRELNIKPRESTAESTPSP
jgi:hypothetical protein